jgi:hypothetical protein
MTSEIYVADRDNTPESIFDEMDAAIDSIMRELNERTDD